MIGSKRIGDIKKPKSREAQKNAKNAKKPHRIYKKIQEKCSDLNNANAFHYISQRNVWNANAFKNSIKGSGIEPETTQKNLNTDQ